MAWELSIHHIDVGQGQSTLIVARNPVTGIQRSMLFDGGHAQVANIVHNYIANNLFGEQHLDRLVTSHYDNDHSGGITELLIADNKYIRNRIIARAAAEAAEIAFLANNAIPQMELIAVSAAAATVACKGGYDPLNIVQDFLSTIAINTGQQVLNNLPQQPFQNENEAANYGYTFVQNQVLGGLFEPLVRPFHNIQDIAMEAGIEAGDANNFNNRLNNAYQEIHVRLQNTTNNNSRFETNGRYKITTIIDVGNNTVQAPHRYNVAIQGTFAQSNGCQISVPANRNRITPVLGQEILWNVGNNPQAAPMNAPAVYVVAINREVFFAPVNQLPIAGDAYNNVSIGLVVKFNNFFYFLGGDLPSEGENLIVNHVLNPNLHPQHQLFNVPNHVCCFQCSHHGANTSSSQNFIDNLHTRAAFISVGGNQDGNQFGHPTQNVIDRLHNNNDIEFFYLTNCKLITNNVPASSGEDQIMAQNNKSRVAGDNNNNNLAPNRSRGNIVVMVDEAESNSLLHPPNFLLPNQVFHRFRVSYWEEDQPGAPGVRVEIHNH